MESVTKTNIPQAELAKIVEAHLGVGLMEAHELKDGWFNTTYALTLSDGRKAVLKAAPSDDIPVMRYEWDILRSELRAMELVRGRTEIPVPEVLAEDFSRRWLPLDFYIMSWLPGQVLNTVQEQLPPDELSSIRREIGSILRTLNAIPGEQFGMFARPVYGSWREAFVGMMEDICLDGEASPVELDYDAIRSTVERHAPALEVVRDPRLVHWDLWEGNIGVADGRVSGVIDFERSFWGDPLMEINWMNTFPEFIAGYGTDLRDTPHSRERRHLYDLHLFTIMQVEAWYRRFTDLSGVEWAKRRFAETMAALA